MQGAMTQTCHGVALFPGERVVYYSPGASKKGTRIVLAIFGALLLIGVIGLVFILLAIFMKDEAATVVTTQRVMAIYPNGSHDAVPLARIDRLVRRRVGSSERLDVHGLGKIVSLSSQWVRLSPNPAGPSSTSVRPMADVMADWRAPGAVDREPSVPHPA